MGLETQLRESLLSYAGAAPSGAGLLDGVRSRHKRFQRRRWSAAAAGIAAVLAAAVSVPSLVDGGQHDPVTSFPPPILAAADFEMPYFPYEITWMPPGAGELSVQYGFDTGTAAHVQVPDGYMSIVVSDRPVELPMPVPHDQWDTTVAGHPAKQNTALVGDQPWMLISWEQDGRWLAVEARGSVTPTSARRVGEGLRPGRIDIQSPIKLRLAPDGWVVGSVGGGPLGGNLGTLRTTPSPTPDNSLHYTLCLTKPQTAGDSYQFLCVNLDKEKYQVRPDDPRVKKITVNGADAWLISRMEIAPDVSQPTVVFESGDWTVTASHGLGPRLTDQDLIRFAEGISIVEP